jgi:hypothetical protein
MGCYCSSAGKGRSAAVAIVNGEEGLRCGLRCEIGTQFCEKHPKTFEVQRIPSIQ